jgi:microcystin-dependent protein
MDPYVGSIWSFGFSWAPVGYALCNGNILPISTNEALFALIGTIYGGDGISTFALPNLQGRVPMGTGQGPGLPNYVIGQASGSESVTLLTANLPVHSHPVLSVNWPVSGRNGDQADPNGNFFGMSDSNIGNTYNSASGVTMNGPLNTPTATAGSSIPLDIMSPYNVINYCIAVAGIFPSRN